MNLLKRAPLRDLKRGDWLKITPRFDAVQPPLTVRTKAYGTVFLNSLKSNNHT